MVNGTTQLLQNRTSNANADCGLGPAGKTVPGGFAWIVQSSGQCGGLVNLAVSQDGSDTGNDGPSTVMRSSTNGLPANLGPADPLPSAAGIRRCHRDRFRSLLRLVGLRVVQCAGWAFGGADKLPLVYNNASSSDKNLQCKATVAESLESSSPTSPFLTATSWDPSARTAPRSSNSPARPMQFSESESPGALREVSVNGRSGSGGPRHRRRDVGDFLCPGRTSGPSRTSSQWRSWSSRRLFLPALRWNP